MLVLSGLMLPNRRTVYLLVIEVPFTLFLFSVMSINIHTDSRPFRAFCCELMSKLNFRRYIKSIFKTMVQVQEVL